jgi:hypothetical protein
LVQRLFEEGEDMSDAERTLVDHVYLTYRSLRVALAITCFAIPLGLIVVGAITHVGLQDSLSNYYYAEFPPKLLRVLFVGLLFLLGGLFIAYRGFDAWDNRIHNLAGVFAIGVAGFPMHCPYTDPASEYFKLCYMMGPTWTHYVSALLLFGMAIVSIWYNGGSQFEKLSEEYIKDKIASFRIVRTVSGVIVGGGVAYALMMLGIGGKELLGKLLWIPESMGFIGFGLYWGALTAYISVANTRAEEKAKEETVLKKVPSKGPKRAIP